MTRFGRALLWSDVLATGGFGFFGPVLAIFITRQVPGADAATVGLAVAVYLVARTVGLLVTTRSIGSGQSYLRELRALIGGSAVLTLVPIGYLMVREPAHLYLAQAAWGLGESLTLPAWFSLFRQAVEQDHEGRRWLAREVTVTLGAAAAAAAGGWVAVRWGFGSLFVAAAVLAATATYVMVRVYRREVHGERVGIRQLG